MPTTPPNHKHPNVTAWLDKHPRYQTALHPTSGSWLNMVEIFFGIITKQAIRRGTFPIRQGPQGSHPDSLTA